MKLTNVLFLGNSLTFVNDLPKMFRSLGRGVKTSFFGVGAASFQTLYNNPSLPLVLGEKRWDYVVLQEQSMFLAQAPSVYKQTSTPYAKLLYTLIQNHTKNVILFETWAYQNGNPSLMTGLDDDYTKMQRRLYSGYNFTLAELKKLNGTASVVIAPVGEVWSIARRKGLKLWQNDGIHPSKTGTFLAAAVFYSTIFNQRPAIQASMKYPIDKRDVRKIYNLLNI